MALVVEKYGGTSVGTLDRIDAVADRVARSRGAGDDIVVVVSAMAGETDRLLDLAHNIKLESGDGREEKVARSTATTGVAARELDVLLSTGEQVTIALLVLALHSKGIQAKSYTGAQVPIQTDSIYGKARILDIDPANVRTDLETGKVVVIAGFQGVDVDGNITTLGRGGTDTTAVAMAASLQADECRIYTDVEGVYTADPRIVPNARRLERITAEEMLELASLGAKVLQTRSVEFAGKYHVPLRVLSSFVDGPGTLITHEVGDMEQPLIAGIAYNGDEAKLTIRGVPDQPGVASRIFGPISKAHINVDMIIQNVGLDQTTDLTFTVKRDEYETARSILTQVAEDLGAHDVVGDNTLAKISIVGVGMRSHAGIASTMFEVLANEGINIELISTSEIKVSVGIADKYLELAVRSLHKEFNLDTTPLEDPLEPAES
ncbi:MAG: aspartate kinase [Acidiferrobacteraceae bacterium]|nr:aspartate kinase [Acidiferrobacteraceae bacterium]